MTEPREPTLKQWKRRALQAEQTVEFLQGVRAREACDEMRQHRPLRNALRAVALTTWTIRFRSDPPSNPTPKPPVEVAFSCLENSKCELTTKFWPY